MGSSSRAETFDLMIYPLHLEQHWAIVVYEDLLKEKSGSQGVLKSTPPSSVHG